MIILFLLLFDSTKIPTMSEYTTDLIEINHRIDKETKDVIYSQFIFYEFSDRRYYVQSWMVIDKENTEDVDFYAGFYKKQIMLYNKTYLIKSKHFRETWTTFDPEVENKKILKESLRHRFW